MDAGSIYTFLLPVAFAVTCYAATSTVGDQWRHDGKVFYIGKFEVTPASSITSGWIAKLTFNSETDIIECYHGDMITSGYRTVHRMKNKRWNANVTAGSTLAVMFQARTTASSPTTAQVILEGVSLQGSGGSTSGGSTSGGTTGGGTTGGTTSGGSTIGGSTTGGSTTGGTTSAGTTSGGRPSPGEGCPATKAHDYRAVLTKSILFYEAQRSGRLPSSNRIPWRGDSALGDRDGDVDLTGGWYDAGDYVKFNFPMAWSVTTLAWGILDFKAAYTAAQQYSYAQSQIKWALDYLLKCHAADNVFYVQVGNGNIDHSYFGRPEEMTLYRPAYKIDATRPGSDIAAEAAAAMAAGSLVFKDSDPVYATTLRTHAKKLFTFAKNYPGKYSDHGSEFDFYKSNGYDDEMVWAAAWLYRATNDNSYLTFAEQKMVGLGSWASWAFSWDDKRAGAQVLLHQITGKATYKTQVETFLGSWRKGGGVKYTPQCLAWRDRWGPNRYTANTAALALLASKNGSSVDMGLGLNNREWAKYQVDLLLGDSGRSYVVGYGTNFPRKPHHRSSTCPVDTTKICDASIFGNEAVDNDSILQGALVGGPAENGSYKDKRGDYVQSEVACDYNAGWQTAVAGLLYFETLP